MPLPHGDAHGGAFDFWPGPLGEVLFYLSQVLPGRRRRDDHVVGRTSSSATCLEAAAPAARLTVPRWSDSHFDESALVERFGNTRTGNRSPVRRLWRDGIVG